MDRLCEHFNIIRFAGAELQLPDTVPFAYRDGDLLLDFSAGFEGKLLLQKVPLQRPPADHVRPLSAPQHANSGGQLPAIEDSLDLLSHPPQVLEEAAGSPGDVTGRALDFQIIAPENVPEGDDSKNGVLALTDDLQHRAAGQTTAEAQAPGDGSHQRSHDRSAIAAPVAGTGAVTGKQDLPANGHAGHNTSSCGGDLAESRIILDAGRPPPASTDKRTVAPDLHGLSATDSKAAAHRQPAQDAVLQGQEAGKASALQLVSNALAEADREGAFLLRPGACSTETTPAGPTQSLKENETPNAGPTVATGSGLPTKQKRSADTTGPRSGRSKRAKKTPETPSKELQLRWSQVEAEGDHPPERWGGSLTALSDTEVVLYGGAGEEGDLGDVWRLSSGEVRWHRAPDGLSQSQRCKAWHAAAVVAAAEGPQLLVYGGERSEAAASADGAASDGEEEDTDTLNECCLLDSASGLWVDIEPIGEGRQGPPPRAGAAAVGLPGGRVLVFGGADKGGRFRNDAFVLDARRLAWFPLAGIARGAPPKPRAYHSATLVGNRIVILGGLGARAWSFKEVYTLNIETWKWSEHTPEVGGDIPSPRSGHAAAALAGERYVLVFGGGNAEQDLFFSSAALLDTHTWQWIAPRMQGVARPSGRAGHAMARVAIPSGRQAMVVHGGRAKGDTLCRDTWLLEVL